MNQEDGGNNPSNKGQNNIIAQTLATLVQVIENMQPASANRPKEQNIVQVFKFNGYGNEDLTEWAKRFDIACLTNNWPANCQKNIAGSFLDRLAF